MPRYRVVEARQNHPTPSAFRLLAQCYFPRSSHICAGDVPKNFIKEVSPNIDNPLQVIYGNQNWYTTYRGVSPDFFSIQRWSIDRGALFSDDDVDRAAGVLRDRPERPEALFGLEEPIGKVVRLSGGTPSKVVGSVRVFWYRSKKCLH